MTGLATFTEPAMLDLVAHFLGVAAHDNINAAPQSHRPAAPAPERHAPSRPTGSIALVRTPHAAHRLAALNVPTAEFTPPLWRQA